MKVNQSSELGLSGAVSRRQFIGGCAGCAAGLSALVPLNGGSEVEGKPDQDRSPAAGWGDRPKIGLILTYPDPSRPIWPNIGYDFDTHNREFVNELEKVCPTVEFLVTTVNSDAEALTVTAAANKVDGYLVYFSGCNWDWPRAQGVGLLAGASKPLILVDHLHAGSGAFLTTQAAARREGVKALTVSSSEIKDVAEAVRCVGCVKQLRQSALLVVGSEPRPETEECYGTRVEPVAFSELAQTYKKVDPTQARERSERWIREAQRVVEPSAKEIEKSATMYLTMAELLRRRKAQAIAVNCLGGFYSGHLNAYPCLGFMQLNNDGFVGACEADQRSAITMLLMAYVTGRPGFISDPVIDTSKNQIIYDHCIAPTKVFGPEGPANPYHIRDHSEDRQGACNRSLMPLGEMTTTIQFDAARKQVILHQAVTVENLEEDMACRNKLAAEVKGDVYKLLDAWDQWGWHRVTFYGDYKRAVQNIAELLDFEVIEEA